MKANATRRFLLATVEGADHARLADRVTNRSDRAAPLQKR